MPEFRDYSLTFYTCDNSSYRKQYSLKIDIAIHPWKIFFDRIHTHEDEEVIAESKGN